VGIGINVNQVNFDPSIPNRFPYGRSAARLLILWHLHKNYWFYWNITGTFGRMIRGLLGKFNKVLYRRGEKCDSRPAPGFLKGL